MIGRVYTGRDAPTGYWMVMAGLNGFVIISPFFWRADGVIMLNRMAQPMFNEAYRPFNEDLISSYHVTVQAKYDLEKLRRLRWIAATGGLYGKDQSPGYVYGNGRDRG